MIYSVINMDIIGSRKIEDRSILQDKLKKYFDYLNSLYKDILATSISFTLGDEWQIILKKPEESYNIINRIKVFLSEIEIKTYAGIGIGTISTNIYESTSLMDGEAFIYAREAINMVKNKNQVIKSKLNKVYLKGRPCYLFNEFDGLREVALTTSNDTFVYNKSLVDVINVLIENTEIIFNKITPKQLSIIKLYEEFGSYNKMVEENVAKSKSDISQKLNSAEYFVLKNNKELIKKLLVLYILTIK
ncbi:SatD family protein [Clostridium sp. SHJSY1]|uniref:SatD family protein n=1 Tax=Clostridium sp. SHJSY1 TaxID=2942483 RepID=UPI002876019D|nr:SatD family protein [Clostridium sp. SHJSY1]MDS0524532.1 SatD family protein [Clostridium sp. SHJSY1]